MIQKIGILGAGNVGMVLGKKWAEKGIEITFGVREPSKYTNLSSIPNINVVYVKELVKTLDYFVLALPGKDLGTSLDSIGNFTGKNVIDATNMFGMKKLQEKFPSTNFVKAFNHIGYNIMDNPLFGNDRVTLLYCGDNQHFLGIVRFLIELLGFEPFLVGDSSFVSDLENFALLWIKLSKKIGREFGFKLLKR
jgi:hypothetical protein